MRNLFVILSVMVCIICIGCAPVQTKKEEKDYCERAEALLGSLKSKGFLTLDELSEFDRLAMQYSRVVTRYRNSDGTYYYVVGLHPVLGEIYCTVIIRNGLPFESMFYLALEKENYSEAEDIRLMWIGWLKKDPPLAMTNPCPNFDIKIKNQLVKLEGVVGLTDPMLITLRKELMLAIKDKKWDDASKIQNLISAKVKELAPPPQPIIISGGSQTPVIVEQPSKIQFEQLPRYGVSDYARVLSIIGGKTMTSKDAATLKLFDMIIGR